MRIFYYLFISFCVVVSSTAECLRCSKRDINADNRLPETYRNLVEDAKNDDSAKIILKASECMRNVMNISINEMFNEFLPGIQKLEIDKLPNALKFACPNLHHIFQCFRTMQEEKLLANPEDGKIKILLSFFPVFENMAKFTCDDDDGEILLEFLRDRIPECASEQNQNLINCVDDFAPEKLSLRPDIKQCGELDDLQECIVEIIRIKCNSIKAADIIDIVWEEFMIQMQC